MFFDLTRELINAQTRFALLNRWSQDDPALAGDYDLYDLDSLKEFFYPGADNTASLDELASGALEAKNHPVTGRRMTHAHIVAGEELQQFMGRVRVSVGQI